MAKFPYFVPTKQRPKGVGFNPKAKRLEKLSKEGQADLVFDLINAFALAKDPLSSSLLLQDLLTASEIKNLSKRLRIAKLILQGKTHEEIVEILHCSYGTISKVRSWLEEAGEGLKKVIKKLPKRKKKFEFKKDALGYYGLPQIIIGSYLNHLETKEKKRIENFFRKLGIKTNFTKPSKR